MKLIIGKNGFIAKKLVSRNEYQFTTSDVNDSSAFYLDLKNPKKFDYTCLNTKTTIVFLAAVSSPDECNNNYEEAYKINVTGSIYFTKEAIKKGAKVLFFSSDVVYGNTTESVNESSKTNPFGNYAKMKDEVEKAFEREVNFKVFRLSYVLSSEDKYLSYLKSCIVKNAVAEVFHPFSRKVVYIEDVLQAIENIIEKWNSFDSQKINICGNEDISRKDIADFYNEASDNKLNYIIIEPNDKFWEARPKDIDMTSIYLEKLLGRKPIKIIDAINKIIQGEK
jgi:dTDP-4-dehydrorhamnose reductase